MSKPGKTPDTQWRNRIIGALIDDPRATVDAFYATKSKWLGLGKKEVVAGEFSLNDPQLCCLVGQLGYTPAQLPEFCLLARVIEQDDLVDLTNDTSVFAQVITDKQNATPLGLLKTIKLSSTPNIRAEDITDDQIKIMQREERVLRLCNFPDLRDNLFISSDEYTNDFLIGSILSILQKLPEWKFPYQGILEYISGSICQGDGNYGVIMMETSPSSLALYLEQERSNYYQVPIISPDLVQQSVADVLRPEIFMGIVGQAISLLSYLEDKFAFHFGISTLDSWYIVNKPVSFTYAGYTVSSPVTIKMANFGVSSISVNSTKANRTLRLHASSSWISRYLSFSPFHPKVDEIGGELLFQLDNVATSEIKSQMYYAGIPFYSQTDIYIFMLSLFTTSGALYLKRVDPRINAIWQSLWIPDQQDKMDKRLARLISGGSKIELNSLINALKGIQLYCDVASRILSGLSDAGRVAGPGQSPPVRPPLAQQAFVQQPAPPPRPIQPVQPPLAQQQLQFNSPPPARPAFGQQPVQPPRPIQPVQQPLGQQQFRFNPPVSPVQQPSPVRQFGLYPQVPAGMNFPQQPGMRLY